MTSKNGGNAGWNNAPPKYIHEFSKQLATEVRVLVEEVGKLRDERRRLQFEIAELMSVKSKHGAGGTYSPDWRPMLEEPPMPEPAPPPPAPEEPPAPARPAWRTVHKRTGKHKSVPKIEAPPASAPHSPPPPPALAAPSLPSWAQWRPNPTHSPLPMNTNAITSSPARQGLFGSEMD